ncbi:MAG: hypothetical protein AB2L18_08435 [Anaerolineaceae bacterium]
MKNKVLFILVLGAFLLAACGTTPTKEATTLPAVSSTSTTDVLETSGSSMVVAEVSFSKDIWPVIQQFALPAHSTEGKGGIFLESYDDIMKYVIPGDPASSVLYQYLIGDGVPVMPPTGKLPDATIQLFYDWITQGAKNN